MKVDALRAALGPSVAELGHRAVRAVATVVDLEQRSIVAAAMVEGLVVLVDRYQLERVERALQRHREALELCGAVDRSQG